MYERVDHLAIFAILTGLGGTGRLAVYQFPSVTFPRFSELRAFNILTLEIFTRNTSCSWECGEGLELKMCARLAKFISH
jgi:hypothetical protein